MLNVELKPLVSIIPLCSDIMAPENSGSDRCNNTRISEENGILGTGH